MHSSVERLLAVSGLGYLVPAEVFLAHDRLIRNAFAMNADLPLCRPNAGKEKKHCDNRGKSPENWLEFPSIGIVKQRKAKHDGKCDSGGNPPGKSVFKRALGWGWKHFGYTSWKIMHRRTQNAVLVKGFIRKK